MKARPHQAKPVRQFLPLAIALANLVGCGPHVSPGEIEHSLEANSQEVAIDLTAAFTPEEIAAANFQFIKDKVFTPHCLKCHASDVQRGDVNLEEYSTAFQLRREIRAEVAADRMPRRAPPLSPELKELLFSWIDNGAREL